jgi:hypothetical protein
MVVGQFLNLFLPSCLLWQHCHYKCEVVFVILSFCNNLFTTVTWFGRKITTKVLSPRKTSKSSLVVTLFWLQFESTNIVIDLELGKL